MLHAGRRRFLCESTEQHHLFSSGCLYMHQKQCHHSDLCGWRLTCLPLIGCREGPRNRAAASPRGGRAQAVLYCVTPLGGRAPHAAAVTSPAPNPVLPGSTVLPPRSVAAGATCRLSHLPPRLRGSFLSNLLVGGPFGNLFAQVFLFDKKSHDLTGPCIPCVYDPSFQQNRKRNANPRESKRAR